jgi:hypothetical protein
MSECLRCIYAGIHAPAISQQFLNPDHLMHVVLLIQTSNPGMISIASWLVSEVILYSEQGKAYVFMHARAHTHTHTLSLALKKSLVHEIVLGEY